MFNTILNVPEREIALNDFYTTWEQDALVVDKWFALQAASKLPNALTDVKKLLQHEAFDIKNPNKVYALVGTFCHRNAVRFHAANGEGYAIFVGYCFATEYIESANRCAHGQAFDTVETL